MIGKTHFTHKAETIATTVHITETKKGNWRVCYDLPGAPNLKYIDRTTKKAAMESANEIAAKIGANKIN